MLGESFRSGGPGMWLTACFGLLLLGAAIWFAVRPTRERALLWSLGLLTLGSGLLWFVLGLIKSTQGITQVPEPDRWSKLVAVGFGESLHNIGLALALVTFALLVASVGAFRLCRAEARQALLQAAAHPPRPAASSCQPVATA